MNSIRLRFALHGPRNNKIFHLVAINAKKARNAQPLETLAVYSRRKDGEDGVAKIEWSVDRIIHWLSKGAEPSKSAVKFLEMGNIEEEITRRQMGRAQKEEALKTLRAAKPQRRDSDQPVSSTTQQTAQ